MIGPGNIISGNLRGVRISGPGPGAVGVVVRDNLIGTDITGTLDFGNAIEGVRIEDATDAVIQGNASGSQVISGNLVGVAIAGSSSTRNLVVGNLIGSDKSGLEPAAQLAGRRAHRLGARQHDRRDNGRRAEPDLGQPLGRPDGRRQRHGQPGRGQPDRHRHHGDSALGNEVNGVIVSTNASNNTIGGITADLRQHHRLQRAGRSLGRVGHGRQHPLQQHLPNGMLGIDLVAPGIGSGPNNLQRYPRPRIRHVQRHLTHVHGTLNSALATTFLIQFFTDPTPDPSGFGQGRLASDRSQVTTEAAMSTPHSTCSSPRLFPPGW